YLSLSYFPTFSLPRDASPPLVVAFFCSAFLSNLKMPQNGLAKRYILNALLVRAKALRYYVLWSFIRQ
ncbi:hypothetical protein, partial [Prevotellamassilia timonensis]|uniref:hypothetical protein n=1 Tax=Prevotellamassilia timonensis TaxID=1852370 RepID=UPI003A8F435D